MKLNFFSYDLLLFKQERLDSPVNKDSPASKETPDLRVLPVSLDLVVSMVTPASRAQLDPAAQQEELDNLDHREYKDSQETLDHSE